MFIELNNEHDVIKLISEDHQMMEILRAAKSLDLPDWWICAGFVRSKIWDTLHGFNERTIIRDVDVIYYDSLNVDETIEKLFEEKLKRMIPEIPWSVKNQARMHVINNIAPYKSSIDAISKFPETATALGVKLDKNDHVILTAPHGVDDVINLKVKPTPFFTNHQHLFQIYEERLVKKNWKSIWPKIIIHHT